MERVFSRLEETHNMIAGSQLAAGRVEQTLPAQSTSDLLRTAWNKFISPVRMVARLRATIESHAPVGYEDESGFHYSRKSSEWFFTI